MHTGAALVNALHRQGEYEQANRIVEQGTLDDGSLTVSLALARHHLFYKGDSQRAFNVLDQVPFAQRDHPSYFIWLSWCHVLPGTPLYNVHRARALIERSQECDLDLDMSLSDQTWRSLSRHITGSLLRLPRDRFSDGSYARLPLHLMDDALIAAQWVYGHLSGHHHITITLPNSSSSPYLASWIELVKFHSSGERQTPHPQQLSSVSYPEFIEVLFERSRLKRFLSQMNRHAIDESMRIILGAVSKYPEFSSLATDIISTIESNWISGGDVPTYYRSRIATRDEGIHRILSEKNASEDKCTWHLPGSEPIAFGRGAQPSLLISPRGINWEWLLASAPPTFSWRFCATEHEVVDVLQTRGSSSTTDEIIFLELSPRWSLKLQDRLANLVAANYDQFPLIFVFEGSFKELFDMSTWRSALIDVLGSRCVRPFDIRLNPWVWSAWIRHLLERYRTDFQGHVLLTDDVDRFPNNTSAISLAGIEQKLADLFSANQFEPYLKIDAAALGLHRGTESDQNTFDERMSLSEIVFNTERNAVLVTIERYNGQIAPAAKALGLSRQGLYKKLKKLDIGAHK